MMNILSPILNVAISLFEAICINIFMGTFMERRSFRGKKLNTLLVVVGYGLALRLGSEVLLPPAAKALLMIAVYILVSLAFYKSRLIIRVVLNVLYYFLLFICDLLILSLLVAVFSSNYIDILSSPMHYILGIIITRIVQYTLVMLIKRFWTHTKLQSNDANTSWLLLLFPPAIAIVSICAFIVCLSENLTVVQMFIVSFSAIGLMFLGIIMISLMDTLVDRQRKVKENALLRQKVEIEMESVMALSDSFNNQRKMMHDYDNHIGTIKLLLQNQQYAKAEDYVYRMSDFIATTIYRIKTNNDIIDAVLNQKDLVAEGKGISIDYVTNDLSALPIHSDDLVTIVANVLDNAIEAVAGLEESRRHIDVRLEYSNRQFVFSVINPVDAKVEISNNHIRTTKKDQQVHGIGLNNIRTTLEKYGSDFELFCDESEFQFTTVVTFSTNAVQQPA